jgi:polysaccharide export outer membrane protein
MRQGTTNVRLKSTAASDPATDEEENTTALHPSPGIRPLASRSDFEVFVEDAAGRPVKIYGRNLFEEVPSTFAPMDHIPVPANYAIGPGDELLIRVWGKIDLDARVTVDRNGQIALAKVGTLNVAGLRYEQLEDYLRMAIGSLYKGFELNVALGKLRSIQILVLGSARRPGQYTVGSLSTLVDALFASGGPSSTGTMRHIQLRRDSRMVVDFDLYDLQQKGDKTHDVQLLAGDEIYIPAVGPQVAIVGNVNEPGIFELKGETTIASAVEGAGGLTNLAATARVLLERIEDRKLRRVDEFALDVRGLQRMLRDGDLLRISPISPQFENAVTIRGNVASPGRFPWHEGMRVSDLVPSREFLLTSDHWNQQNHLADERHTDMMTDIALSNAEINWGYAAIERLDKKDLSTRLIAFNLGSAIDNAASSDNQLLKVGDVITIFSRKDLPLPLEKHSTFVRIGGEVNAPGVYRVNPSDSLRDAVARAGGLTAHSYLYASQLTRVSTRQIQEGQLKLSIGRMEKELLSQYATSGHAAENVNAAQAADARGSDQQGQLGLQRALIAQLSSAQPTGRVVLGIKPDAKTVEQIPDFPLEDGDSFYIPPRLGTIQVAGEVYNENAFRYEVRKPLYQYLNDSGGATRLADVKRIFLIRADGTVMSRQSHSQHWPNNFEKVVLMPGDAIVVPPKIKTPGVLMEEFSKITQILSQTAMTGAVLSLIQ